MLLRVTTTHWKVSFPHRHFSSTRPSHPILLRSWALLFSFFASRLSKHKSHVTVTLRFLKVQSPHTLHLRPRTLRDKPENPSLSYAQNLPSDTDNAAQFTPHGHLSAVNGQLIHPSELNAIPTVDRIFDSLHLFFRHRERFRIHPVRVLKRGKSAFGIWFQVVLKREPRKGPLS